MTAGSGDDVSRLVVENQALRAALDRRHRWRGRLTALLVVLTSLTVVVAATALWVHQVVFDTDRFMETVEPALDDPRFATLLADRASESALEALALDARATATLDNVDRYLSETLVEALDPSDRALAALERLDRPALADLAPAIASSLEGRVDEAIHAFFGSEAFAARFPDLVRRTHEVAVSLAKDELNELPNVYVEDGAVRLNLTPFIAEALGRVAEDVRAVVPDFQLPDVVSDQVDEGREQVADALRTRLPADFGQVTVMSAGTLAEIQAAAALMDRYVWLAILTAILLIVLTVAVSPHRRSTALHLGVGVVVAVVLTELLVRRLEEAIVEQVVDPSGAALAAELARDALSGLRSTELLLAVIAVLVAIIAYVVGRPAWLDRLARPVNRPGEDHTDVRQWEWWVSANAGALRLAGIALALVVLLIAGLDPLPVIIVALALAAYLWLVSAVSGRARPVTVGPDAEVRDGQRPTTPSATS